MSGQVPYVSQSVGMTAADAQQVGTDQTVVASTTSLTDINKVVRVEASLTGASITGNCAVSGNVSASSLAVTGAITGGSINSTPIGATTPSTGSFTTLSTSGNSVIGGGVSTFTRTRDLTIRGTSNDGASVSVDLAAIGSSGTATYHIGYGAGTGWDINYATSDDQLKFYKNASTAVIAAMTSSGLAVTGNISSTARTLVGTTTDDGVNALQVNGSAKATSIKFANTGGTKQALDYYEEGAWTPIDGSGAGLTFSIQDATYTRIGRQVTAIAYFIFPATASAASAIIGGLPFVVRASQYQPVTISASVVTVGGSVNAVTTTISLTSAPGTYGVLKTNAGLSGNGITLVATYFI